MEIVNVLVDEQQAISLIALGFLSIALAFTIGQFFSAGKAAIRHAFWSAQILLASAGASILLLPTVSYGVVLVTIFGSTYPLHRLHRTFRHKRQASV